MSDLQRITSDMKRCKERIAQMEQGERGQVPSSCRHQDSGRAFERQLIAQRDALARLEMEYVQAMLAEHKWVPQVVMARMEADNEPAAVEQPRVVLGDATRARLAVLLEENRANFIPRSKLQELLQK